MWRSIEPHTRIRVYPEFTLCAYADRDLRDGRYVSSRVGVCAYTTTSSYQIINEGWTWRTMNEDNLWSHALKRLDHFVGTDAKDDLLYGAIKNDPKFSHLFQIKNS